MKIHITGNAGSGKTTLAKELAEIFDLPVYGLDKLVWQKGWLKTPQKQRDEMEELLIAKAEWIIEGYSEKVRRSSDVVIFLDYPRYLCFWRVAKRNVRFLFSSRPELPEGCPEIMNVPYLLRIIWKFPFVSRKLILADLDLTAHQVITRQSDLRTLVDSLRESKSF